MQFAIIEATWKDHCFVRTRKLQVSLILALIGLASAAHADITFTMTPGAGGTVDMNIRASGTVAANQHTWLLIGDPVTDSFLNSNTPSSGRIFPAPTLRLDGKNASNTFYRDDNGTRFIGVQSLLGFFFGFGNLSGVLDLSDLNGDYNLQGSDFNHFVPGSHTGLVPGASIRDHLQNLGDITVIVAPEPNTFVLASFCLVGFACVRRKRQ